MAMIQLKINEVTIRLEDFYYGKGEITVHG